jgi:metallo-beta-lactamase family protein
MSDNPKTMKLSFHGAAGDVTGANFMAEVDSGIFLVDCGLHQGGKFATERNRDPFPYNPADVDVLLVTHAHQDHIGRIPKLVKDGFNGVIYSTTPTMELAEIMLLDTLGIMTEQAREDGILPMYDKKDVQKAMSLWKGVPYHNDLEFLPGVRAFFRDAGHVLGSATIEISYGDKKILFTGDLGNSPTPLLHNIEETSDVNYIVMESVYGDRNHHQPEQRTAQLEKVIEDTVNRGGTLMIPAFSLERTQELLFELNDLVENKRIPRVPIFLDSPLAISVTEIYQHSTEYFNKNTRKIINSGDDIFDFPGLKMTPRVEDSKKINVAPSPKIIVAGSGMMNGGRMLHHALHNLSDPDNTLLFIGYQAAGTLGRVIQDGAKKVKIFREMIPVKAHIETIEGYSGHAGSDQLIQFVEERKKNLEQVFCVMGEPTSSLFLVQRLRDYLGVNAQAPQEGESVELEF